MSKAKSICPDCKHEIEKHTFSDNYCGCDVNECQCGLHLGFYIDALEARLKEAEEIMLELAGEEECDDGFNVFEHPEHTCIDAERTRRAAAFLKGGAE